MLATPPWLILLVAAAALGFLRPSWRPLLVLGAPLLALYGVWQMADGVLLSAPFMGYQIELVSSSPLRRLFATVFLLICLVGGLFALRHARWWEQSAALAYAAGALGVCFAGDLITLFLAWELMVIFSTVVVWCGGTPAARRAGIRYAIMHLIGGVILKIGVEGIVTQTGTYQIQALPLDNFYAWMVLAGILVNAAAPPVSAWLADAYPESSPTGMVFLSAFTTKTAVLSLILLFPGESVLIWIGLFMAFYGIIYALLENDMRRMLAYLIINQLGFMLCGVGIGTELAINGAAAHAFSHVIYLALLVMCAGAVMIQTGKRRYSDLGGLARCMPLTASCMMVAVLSLSALPLTSGFIAKAMIAQALVEQEQILLWLLLTATSAGLVIVGTRMVWLVLVRERKRDVQASDPGWNMRAAMVAFAALSVLLGSFPELLYGMLPYVTDYQPYRAGNVINQLQLLLFAGLAFFLLHPLLKRTSAVSLDFDWLWRVVGFRLLRLVVESLLKLFQGAEQFAQTLGQRCWQDIVRLAGPYGYLGRRWTATDMLLCMVGLVGALLLYRFLL